MFPGPPHEHEERTHALFDRLGKESLLVFADDKYCAPPPGSNVVDLQARRA